MGKAPKRIQPRVALLMAVHNQAETLVGTLRSLLHQSYDKFTVTIINDGSTDGTAEILSQFNDPRLHIHHLKKSQGVISALNLAYQKSKPAAYYGVVYASAFYDRRYLSTLVYTLIPQVQYSGIYCFSTARLQNGQECIFKEVEYRHSELLCRSFLEGGVIFRAACFKQAQGIFVSEQKGLWETWLRMAKFKPFLQVSQALVRHQATPYEKPGTGYKVVPEKDIYPHLKLQYLPLGKAKMDPHFLKNLRLSDHIAVEHVSRFAPLDLILMGSIDDLSEARKMARFTGSPIVFVTNRLSDLVALYELEANLIYSLTLATAVPEIALEIKQRFRVDMLLYEQKVMPKSEFNFILGKIPGLLNRQKTTILVRSYANPYFLEQTLQHVMALHHPHQFGEIIVLCSAVHPDTQEWLEENNISFYIPQSPKYFPELLYLLQQIKSQFVLSIDAGIVIPQNWFYQVLPFMSDPQVSQVSSYIYKAELPEQRLPFQISGLDDFRAKWPHYAQKLSKPFRTIELLSDSLFLAKKSHFETALSFALDLYPMGHPTVMSLLYKELGFYRLLVKQTTGISLF